MDRNSSYHTPWRAGLALLGGYALAALWTAALARTVPLLRIDATIAATLPAFAIYAGAAVWCFAAATLRRAAAVLAALAGLAALLIWAGGA